MIGLTLCVGGFVSNFFSPNGIAISRDIANCGYDVDLCFLKGRAGPPESKINDLPFELDA